MAKVNQRLVIVPRMDKGYTLKCSLNLAQLGPLSATIWYPGSDTRRLDTIQMSNDWADRGGYRGILNGRNFFPTIFNLPELTPLTDIDSVVQTLQRTVYWKDPDSHLKQEVFDNLPARDNWLIEKGLLLSLD
jgi:hypothetical protein